MNTYASLLIMEIYICYEHRLGEGLQSIPARLPLVYLPLRADALQMGTTLQPSATGGQVHMLRVALVGPIRETLWIFFSTK